MKTILATIIFILTINQSFSVRLRRRRLSWTEGIVSEPAIDILPSSEIDKLISISHLNPFEVNLAPASHNSVEKPVSEPQEIIPPQFVGSAIIPMLPPPATPVNAVAANVPAQNGAVFLGSGSLGVVDLGNGAYALGSGSLGYSMNRAQPRPSAKVPAYPPLPATPNLIPAAVPSPQPVQPPPPVATYPISSNNLDFNHPLLNVPVSQATNPYGYEAVNPNNVGFGDPLPPRPLKIRMQYATLGLQLGPNNHFPDPNAAVFQYEYPVKQSIPNWR